MPIRSETETTATFRHLVPMFHARVPGASKWVFPAPDDVSGSVAVSWESGQDLYIGRVDPEAPPTSTGWAVTSSTQLTGLGNVSDHFHVVAFGYHIIVFSTGDANRVRMIVADSSFSYSTESEIALSQSAYGSSMGNLVDLDDYAKTKTNDLYVVQASTTSNLVAIGIGLYDSSGLLQVGHLIIMVNISSAPLTTDPALDTSFGSGGVAEFRDSSTGTLTFQYMATANYLAQAAAYSSSGGTGSGYEWQVLAPSRMDSNYATTIELLSTSDLETPSEMTSIERITNDGVDDHYHFLSMPMQVLFNNGMRFIVCRDIPDPSTVFSSTSSSSLPSDYGSLVGWLLDENLDFAGWYTSSNPKTFVAGRGNRPHVARYGRHILLLGYDDTNGEGWMMAYWMVFV